jgi:hypothetical protein
MKNYSTKFKLIALVLSLGVLVAGCQFLNSDQPQQPYQPPPSSAITPPVIEYFESKPPEIAYGSSCNLIWKVTGADSVQISPDIGNVSSSGEVAIMPEQRMVYTLVASNSGGNNSATTVVIVNKNLKAKPVALTEEDVIPNGFVYDSSSEPSTKNTISTYHILFNKGPYTNTILDNTVYVYNTVPDLETVFAEDKYNSRMYATDFVAIGTEGYILTINSTDVNQPTYSLKFYKSNVYVKLTGNIPLNQLEKFARINESRIY